MDVGSIQLFLDSLYTDLLMLQDGSWMPDQHSINASLQVLEGLAKELDLECKDNRIISQH